MKVSIVRREIIIIVCAVNREDSRLTGGDNRCSLVMVITWCTCSQVCLLQV